MFFEEGCLDRNASIIRKVPLFYKRPNLTEMNRVYLQLVTVTLSPLDLSPSEPIPVDFPTVPEPEPESSVSSCQSSFPVVAIKLCMGIHPIQSSMSHCRWQGTIGSIALHPGFVNRISEIMNKYLFFSPKTGDIAGGGPGFFPALWALFPACSRPGGGEGCVLRKSCYTE